MKTRNFANTGRTVSEIGLGCWQDTRIFHPPAHRGRLAVDSAFRRFNAGRVTAEQKRAKRERKKKFKTIFINGKQKRVPREPEVDGMPVGEWLQENADPIWLHQNEMWEYIEPEPPLEVAPKKLPQ